MVQVQLDLDNEEDKIVRILMAHADVKDKKTAIKKIIRIFGKKLKKLIETDLGDLQNI